MPQPVLPGGQLGIGHALETTMLEAASAFALVAEVRGVKELAKAPAQTKVMTEARTISFNMRLPLE